MTRILAAETIGNPAANIAIFAVFVVVTLVVVIRVSHNNKTAAEFFTGGRAFSGPQNGIAIAGDYLSAASFLGIAGAIAVYGYDGFLYSVGFLVAWLVALLLVAELLRNTGKFTMADVLSFRLQQRPVRLAAASSTLTVSLFYLLATTGWRFNRNSAAPTPQASTAMCAGNTARRTPVRNTTTAGPNPTRNAPAVKRHRPCRDGRMTCGARCHSENPVSGHNMPRTRSRGNTAANMPRQNSSSPTALTTAQTVMTAAVSGRIRCRAGTSSLAAPPMTGTDSASTSAAFSGPPECSIDHVRRGPSTAIGTR